MRVLVTGATGFIGSHVTRCALDEGHDVIALSRGGSSSRRLDDVHQRVRWVECDLGDSAAVEAVLADVPDVCLHLAWPTEPGSYLDSHENIDCLTASLSFIRWLHRSGCRRVVLAGTSLEYASTERAADETNNIAPSTLYAACKRSLYLTASRLDTSRAWSVASARIFSVYGPHEHPRRLVPFVIAKLLAGERCELSHGKQVRDYAHVKDVAGALWSIAKSSVSGPINVGSGRPVTVAAIASQLGDILDRAERLELGARGLAAGEHPHLVANIGRLRDEVGFTPRYDLESGLSDTVSWWREQLG